MDITFIIPCLNSQKTIFKNYLKLKKFLHDRKLESKIIFINDGSSDATLNELKKIQDKKVKIISNKLNFGKSKSIINTLKHVNSDYIILIDCDLPYFEYLNRMINLMPYNKLVIVNRKIEYSKNLDKKKNTYQIVRHHVSNFLGFLVEIILSLNVYGDTQAGLKGFQVNKDIKNKKFFSEYYFFDIELIHFFRKKNSSIKLIPVKYKISNQSSIRFFSLKNFKIIYEFLRIIFKIKMNSKS